MLPHCLDNPKKGICGISRRNRSLFLSPHHRAGESLIYEVAQPFQIGPQKAALTVSLGTLPAPASDFAGGADVFIFDDIDAIKAEDAVQLFRNTEEINPVNNKPSIMVKYGTVGGFVPLAAKKNNGQLHPFAGTGFGISSVVSYPLENVAGTSGWADKSKAPYRFFELYQFRYDGRTFSVAQKEKMLFAELLPGWLMLNRPMSNAIPDGDDLLFCMQGQNLDMGKDETGERGMAGIMRWRYGKNGWRPVSFVPVTEGMRTFEPSLVRDLDGTLLFCARPNKNETDACHDVIVWRSEDNGHTWKIIIRAPMLRSRTPVSVNITPVGVPFVAGNLYGPYMQPCAKNAGGNSREILCLWPLSDDRTYLMAPFIVRCASLDFGVPPEPMVWSVDHPFSSIVQLADDRWHAVLSYRVRIYRKELSYPEYPGCYLEDIVMAGNVVYRPWLF